MIWAPCNAKRITMVNNKPYSAHGLIAGRNFDSYQPRPLTFSPNRRDRYPAISGIPRNIKTDVAISHGEAVIAV
ncbi:Uncharacterised protein [Mycobacteroides abscessus subsp. abscessus]|nr:Uncharacterised protein [Mycobacteroides abscessus subsp. abscessus]